jgi:hypothetical protein
MLRAVPYAFVYLFTRLLALFCVSLPSSVAPYVRVLELRLLYLVYSSGPGGFDDAVQITLMKNPRAYAIPLLRLLRKSSLGSSSECIALSFIELVRACCVGSPGRRSRFASSRANHAAKRYSRSVCPIVSTHAGNQPFLSTRRPYVKPSPPMSISTIEHGYTPP